MAALLRYVIYIRRVNCSHGQAMTYNIDMLSLTLGNGQVTARTGEQQRWRLTHWRASAHHAVSGEDEDTRIRAMRIIVECITALVVTGVISSRRLYASDIYHIGDVDENDTNTCHAIINAACHIISGVESLIHRIGNITLHRRNRRRAVGDVNTGINTVTVHANNRTTLLLTGWYQCRVYELLRRSRQY